MPPSSDADTTTSLLKRIAIRVLTFLGAAILFLYIMIWISSPLAFQFALERALQEQGLQLSDNSHIRYNPFLSSVSIEHLAIHTAEKTVLKLEKARIEVDLHKLIFDRLHIRDFDINGLFVDIHQKDQGFIVAGVALPPNEDETLNHAEEPSTPESAPSENTPGEDDGQESSKSYTLTAPTMLLSNSAFEITTANAKHVFLLDSFTLSDIKASEIAQHLSLAIKAKVNNAPLAIKASIALTNNQGNINSELDLSQLDLNALSAEIPELVDSLEGKLSLTISPDITIQEKDLSVTLSDLAFKLNDLVASKDDISASIEEHLTTFDSITVDLATAEQGLDDSEETTSSSDSNTDLNADLNADLNTEASSPATLLQGLTLSGDSSTQGLAVTQVSTSDTLLRWKSLLVSDIHVPPQSSATDSETQVFDIDQLVLGIKNLSIKDLEGSVVSEENQNTDGSPTAALANIGLISIDAISAAAQSLAIGTINVSALNADIRINEEGVIENLVVLASDTPPQEQQNTTPIEESDGTETQQESTANEPELDSPTKEEKPFKLSLGKFQLVDTANIKFQDRSVSPHYARLFYIDGLSIEDVDNQSDKASPFVFVGRSDQYAKFNLQGDVRPFTEKMNLNLNGDLSEFSLPAVSSYIKESLGFEMQSGQLDTRLDVSIKESELGGKVKILLRGLNMTSANNVATSASLKEQTAIPLNVALGMLKDGKGNVNLGVPLNGSVDDPAFGMSSFIVLITKKAVMSQAKSYLMQTFVPYASVVSVAISAGKFALKVRFEDLAYRPTISTLETEQIKYAQQFSQLMQDKPKTQVKICGIASPADIGLLVGEKIEDPKKIEALQEIARSRSDNFKRYAVEQGQIDSARMLLCSPQVDFGKDAQPRISISI